MCGAYQNSNFFNCIFHLFSHLIKCITCPSSIVKRKLGGKPLNCENKPANVEILKISNVQICILSTSIFIFSVKSIKLTSIHNWNICEWTIQFSSYFDTRYRKKIGQILFRVEIDNRRRGYTSSGESGMKSSLLRYLFFCLFGQII